MSLKERIGRDLRQALKAGERERASVLRMLLARIHDAEIAARSHRGRDDQLGDEETVQVLAGYAKQRRESIAAYRQAGREDLATKEQAELAVVESYLPAALDEGELRRLVREAIAEAGATSVRDLGRVMKLLMPKVRGRADGSLVQRLVRDALS